MQNCNFLTLHILHSLPMHNMNRDDQGRPKTLIQGGVIRAMLSSQSLKRAARALYETEMHDISYRSARHLQEEVLARIKVARPDLVTDGAQKDIEKRALTLIKSLTIADKDGKKVAAAVAEAQKEAGDEKDADAAKATSTWLSSDEIDSLVNTIITDIERHEPTTGKPAIGADRTTGSLSIAGFGRMFAAAAEKQTVSAVAVSPATTTHEAQLLNDYFTTMDDLAAVYDPGNAGAAYLDTSIYASGVYYRTVTIDKRQLLRSWSEYRSDDARDRVTKFVRALIYAVPTGKKQSTGVGETNRPILVLAEEQQYRSGYEFDTPVTLTESGGYGPTSAQALLAQRRAALEFDPDVFGAAFLATTVKVDIKGAEVVESNLPKLIEKVVDWVFA